MSSSTRSVLAPDRTDPPSPRTAPGAPDSGAPPSGLLDAARSAAGPDEVYRPQADTRLLLDALGDLPLRGARTLDLCTGSGVVAVEAAVLGARVTAIDAAPAAVRATRTVSAHAGVEVDVRLAGVAGFRCAHAFDVVTCNPPYVPTPAGTEHLPGSAAGPTGAWNAGPDGRAVLDVVCARLDHLLAPAGTALIVQSAFADCERTLLLLREAGFDADVVRSRRIPFGPVLRARREPLRRAGVIPPGCHLEEIAVIRARRPGGAR